VSVPGLPGCWSQGATEQATRVRFPPLPPASRCWSQGATEQEAIDNVREAIREYLSAVEDEAKGQDVREVEVTV